MRRDLRSRIGALVGDAHVLTGAEADGYSVDWTGRFRGEALAVVRPGCTEEVAQVIALCYELGVPVVPQGGNTGLVGGGVPLEGELLLSLSRLRTLGEVDPQVSQVTAGAGVTLGELQRHVRSHGLRYAVDLASRDTATVGGTIATNAGGIHFLRYGGTRQQLRGFEAVLSSGEILRHMGGLLKDNTGYDLGGLLCGSEGTLGVVTAARLQLVREPAHQVVALLGFPSIEAALDAGVQVRAQMEGLDAAELFFSDGMALVKRVMGLADPGVSSEVYLLLEASGGDDLVERLSVALGEASPLDAAVAVEAHRRAELWAYRENLTSAIGTLDPPHKLDVTLPLGRLAEFARSVPEVVRDLNETARCWLFGHALDGNLHVNVTGIPPDEYDVDGAVLRMVAELGGSISAEHGIGRAKRDWLHLARSAEEIAAFRAVKSALDPRGILNPNVLLPPQAGPDRR